MLKVLYLSPVLVVCTLPAQDNEPVSGRRYALLVGVRNYKKDQLKSLKYTENDVNDLAQVLRDAGYKRVVLLTQKEGADKADLLPTGANIRDQLKGLLEDRKPEDRVLVVFSGHGVQFKGDSECYFCPMDATLKDKKSLVSLTEIYEELKKCQAGYKLLISDACRNDPQSDLAKDAGGPMVESVTRPQLQKPPGGVAALFSCSEGQRSFESDELKHGIFFHYLIEGMRGKAANKKGEVILENLVGYVKDEVGDRVKEDIGPRIRQYPHLVGDLRGSVALVSGLKELLGTEMTNSIGMKLVLIKPGKFLMGSPKDEEGRYDSEGPQHEVEITKSFYMGMSPVTQAEYERITGKNPSWFSKQGGGKDKVNNLDTSQFPVEKVAWAEAVAYCESLTREDTKRPKGWAYGLPTEAEWEYACRAGTKTAYSFGNDPNRLREYAWGVENSGNRTHAVGTRKANPLGLYDLHGNVYQWCADWYGGSYYAHSPRKDPKGPDNGEYRVLRGSAWDGDPRKCRAGYRDSGVPGVRGSVVGFRVVLRSP
jgi:formylglycine-generating enzyme required for sulfatase activity